MSMEGKQLRTTQGLRDILFDEIEELQSEKSDPKKSMVVANVAKQIINTAKVELEFNKILAEQAERGQDLKLGNLKLGTEQ